MKVLIIVTEERSFFNRNPTQLDRYTLTVSNNNPDQDVRDSVESIWVSGVSYTWKEVK